MIRPIAAILTLLIGVTIAHADDAPSPARPGQMFQKINENLDKLDLTPDQQKQVKALMDDSRKKLLDLRDQAGGDRNELRTKLRDVFASTREKLAEILTPAQQQKLRDLMQTPQTDDTARAKPNPPAGDANKPAGGTTDMKSGDGSMTAGKTDAAKRGSGSDSKAGFARGVSDATHSSSSPGSSTGDKPASDSPPAIGSIAPPIELHSADGHAMSLAGQKGHVVVVIFGSYSTPTFRDHAAAINQLSRELGTRATVWIIYTREAHATGEWEVDRNHDEKIDVVQPISDGGRIAAAQQAILTLKLTVPVLVDRMDDAVTKTYALTPEGAAVINRDGTIAAEQHWFDPAALRVHVDAATTRPAR